MVSKTSCDTLRQSLGKNQQNIAISDTWLKANHEKERSSAME
jgi:hypothetical protein